MKKKLLSVLLTVAALVSVLTTAAVAADTGSASSGGAGNDNVRTSGTTQAGHVTIAVYDWDYAKENSKAQKPLVGVPVALKIKSKKPVQKLDGMGGTINTEWYPRAIVAQGVTNSAGEVSFSVPYSSNGSSLRLEDEATKQYYDFVFSDCYFDCDPLNGSGYNYVIDGNDGAAVGLVRNLATGAKNTVVHQNTGGVGCDDAMLTDKWQLNGGFQFQFDIYLKKSGADTTPWNTVTFDKNYDCADRYAITRSVKQGSVVEKPADPPRAGYTFKGWYTLKADGTQDREWDFATDKVTGDMTLQAKWEPIRYDIAYTLNGGTNATDNPISYTIEDTVTLSEPTRDNYIFTGWTGSNGDTPQTSVTIEQGSTGAKTFTANWEPETYTINYNLDGGAVSTANPTSYTVETETFTLNNPSKTGYTFKGWSGTGLTGDNNTNVIISKGSTGNRNYTANYTPNQYTVHFDGNGSTGGSMSDQTFTYGVRQALTKNAFEREGYHFTGWNTDRDGGFSGSSFADQEEITTLTITANEKVTLYAQWEPNNDTPYTVKYMIEGLDGNYTEYASSQAVGTTGAEISASPTTIPGFTHVENQVTGTIGGDGKTELVIHYTRNSHTVTYTGTGVTTETYNIKYGAQIPEFQGTYNNPGWKFGGWNCNVDGVTPGDDMPDKDVTFTVKGEQCAYTVVWKVDGQDDVVENDYHYDDKPTYKHGTPTKPADAGNAYIFSGWTPEVTKITAPVPTDAPITYTAVFTPVARERTLTITYTGAFSKTPPVHTETLNVGETYSVPTPVINGYRADEELVSGTMVNEGVNVTVTYTCLHEQDAFGVCLCKDCDHDAACCNPDSTHGKRTFTIQTRNGGTWAAEPNVPVELIMNTNTGWDEAHTVLWRGTTDANGCITVDESALAQVLPGSSIYAAIGDTTDYVWAWTDISYGKLRTASAEANCAITTSGNNDYVYVMARNDEGNAVGFTASTILYVKKAAQAAPVQGKVVYYVYDADGITMENVLENGNTNIVMSLNRRVNGKMTEIGTTAIIDGTGVIELDASEVAGLTAGTVLDCDPTVGHYEWALGDQPVVRYMEIEGGNGAIVKSSNVNESVLITGAITEDFTIYFRCILRPVDEADAPDAGTTTPDQPTCAVNFWVVTPVPEGAAIPNVTMKVNGRYQGQVIDLGTCTTDGNGYATLELDASKLKDGMVIDCDPTGDYAWALEEMNGIVRTVMDIDGIGKGTNVNEDVKVSAASLQNGFEVTFLCAVKEV